MKYDATETYARGDVVRVSSGPFTSFHAVVKEVEEDRSS